jgi:hypothetical protein
MSIKMSDNKNKTRPAKTKRDKKRCKEIGLMLADYASNELLPGEVQALERHVETCPECREEFLLVRRISRETGQLDESCDAVMTSIDWQETAHAISDAVSREGWGTGSRKSRLRWQDLVVSFKWKLAVPMLTGVFLLGIWLGYIFFHSPLKPPGPVRPAADIPSETSLARLEKALAKKEVAGYYKQAQFVLTDLLKQCDTEGSFSIRDQVDIQRVRALLNKSSYFKRNLDDPQLMSNKLLLKKIEWLLYEILMTDTKKENFCRQLQRLQDYIKQERLLLKIRLAEEELSLSEV